mmetsp:Transcript_1505/g.5129  ORF Transcript_1505/g.5129 Transcript_1505/m.5129 type:complete len:207 (+) Transcript_1505:654-1274(+)
MYNASALASNTMSPLDRNCFETAVKQSWLMADRLFEAYCWKSGCTTRIGECTSLWRQMVRGPDSSLRRATFSWVVRRWCTSTAKSMYLVILAESSVPIRFSFRNLRRRNFCDVSEAVRPLSRVMADVMLLTKEENTTIATKRTATVKSLSWKFSGNTRMDAGVNCVMDQCSDITYCSAGSLSMMRCTSTHERGPDTFPIKNQQHAT